MNAASIILACATVLSADANAGPHLGAESKYTNIRGNGCTKIIDDRAAGAYTLNCTGLKGFRLLVHVDDDRSSISVVAPDKRIFPLNFWDVVTPGFSSLGQKAEWRLKRSGNRRIPAAIIVRIDTLDQGNPGRPKHVPYLAIARISSAEACVVAVIKADAVGSSTRARELADTKDLICKQSASEMPPQWKKG